MNDEAKVPEDQTDRMTEPQMEGVSAGGSSTNTVLQEELAVLEKLEQAAMQSASAAAQAEVKAFDTLIYDLTHIKP